MYKLEGRSPGGGGVGGIGLPYYHYKGGDEICRIAEPENKIMRLVWIISANGKCKMLCVSITLVMCSSDFAQDNAILCIRLGWCSLTCMYCAFMPWRSLFSEY